MTGILHYTTTTKGIGGEIKRRITDFAVREITPGGKVLENKIFGDWWPPKQEPLEIPPQPEGKEQLILTMEKFNLDTHEALHRLSRMLRTSAKRIGYAGLKDRRAITSQRISIWNPEVERLKERGSLYVALREPEWSDERIEIGSLSGNEFETTIRNIQMPKDDLERTAQECFEQMQGGVANYFGEQRFGGNREITHRVGKEFIKGNFEGAVLLYLSGESEAEEEEIALARKSLRETGDFAKALKEFPVKFRYERAILNHLVKFPRDFVGAFQALPKHLRYLFTHAYQSYLFNLVINERVEQGIGVQKTNGDILENGVPTGPLFGFDSVIAEGRAGEIEKKVLEKEGTKLEEFRVKGFQELSCSGARKKIALVPQDLKLISIAPDEFNEGKLKMKISFRLGKGNYATTILREIMKAETHKA
ncbi:putative tRNA pseudouridine synthase D [uncultured archaeon]|nr:putative tRNA pseudouridine synthase D [uncultured archaeon]